jgi:two-component system, chemotaxis family, CheB/CheR fusion protein
MDRSEHREGGRVATIKQRRSRLPQFPVVGIGASAGGLEAVSALLDALPKDPGLAIVVVQHLAPQHASILPELLARHASMPVVKVEDRMAVEADHLYVIPPGVDMLIKDGHLDLHARPQSAARNLVIDGFLDSLAHDVGARAIGVVLSGVGSDGSRGLGEIKSAGGITFAQEPSSARFDGMPQSAIDARVADAVLTPAQIAAELVRLATHPYVRRPAGEPKVVSPELRDDWTRILDALREAYGVDFAGYKSGTVTRRTERRMALHRLDSLHAYADLVTSDRGELDELFNDILVMVTEFFREPETYEALKEQVLPAVLEGREPHREVRIWVPGCAAGEEPYSLAMVLLEAMSESGRNFPVKILATDVNERELLRARAGLYADGRVGSVPERYRERFMTHSEEGYRVRDEIREICIFARHDVTRDPPFSRLDLIVCRNLLIYLGRRLQERVLPLLHYALHSGGFLMLGRSESPGSAAELFDVVDKRNKIFRRNDVASHLPVEFGCPFPPATSSAPGPGPLPSAPREVYPDPHEAAAGLLLSEFTPPAVLIDRCLEIVQFFGQTEPYLQHAAGRATLHLLAMAREGLAAPLRELIELVRSEGAAQSKNGVVVSNGEELRLVNVAALPLAEAPEDAHILLVFLSREMEGGEGAGEMSPPSETERREIAALQRELASNQAYLQSLLTAKDQGNEELRAANEETQSNNEELQSINEELETTKEELQSTNEELRTVNEELESRNLELAALNADLSNLLRSMSVPTLIVDSELIIRRFTPGSEAALHLIAADVGRPITDIASRLDVPDLRELLLEVMTSSKSTEREVADESGRFYALRARPFLNAEGHTDGAVLTFLDIDELHRSLEAIRASSGFSESLHRVIAAFAASPTAALALPLLLQEAAATLGADSAAIAARNDTGWLIREGHGLPPDAAGSQFSDLEFPQALLAAETRLPAAVTLPGHAPATTRVMKRLGLGSLLIAPLTTADVVAGVLLFSWKAADVAISAAQMDFAAKIAALAALALENERLQQALGAET